MRVFAFVVTYNRLELLKRVVASLRAQTWPLERIVVVDNSSTDGTGEWLAQQRGLTIITQPNLGGAGGFETGVRYCYEQGADWIWMMDDDVFPASDCLAQMMVYHAESECIQITRYYGDGVVFRYPNWYYQPSRRKHPLFDERTDELYVKAPAGCFEGMLVSRRIVERIGYPDARFFMAGDDTVYGFLASQHTQPIVVKKATSVRAQRSDDRALRPLQIYYVMRNRHLRLAYRKRGCEYALSALRYYGSGVKQIVSLVLSRKPNGSNAAKAIFWGMIDNLRHLTGPSHVRHRF